MMRMHSFDCARNNKKRQKILTSSGFFIGSVSLIFDGGLGIHTICSNQHLNKPLNIYKSFILYRFTKQNAVKMLSYHLQEILFHYSIFNYIDKIHIFHKYHLLS